MGIKLTKRFSGMVISAISIALLGAFAPGASAQTLRSSADLTTKGVRSQETNLGDFIADTMRSAAKCDAAVIAASSFTDVTLPKGVVSAGDVLSALEFRGDSVVVMKLTGQELRRALEHGLALYPQPNSAFLQVSGINMVVDPKAAKGHHVLSVTIIGAPLDPSQSYTVAMPSPLANGALGYFKVWSPSEIVTAKDPKKTIEQCVTSYFASHKTLDVQAGNRIVARK